MYKNILFSILVFFGVVGCSLGPSDPLEEKLLAFLQQDTGVVADKQKTDTSRKVLEITEEWKTRTGIRGDLIIEVVPGNGRFDQNVEYNPGIGKDLLKEMARFSGAFFLLHETSDYKNLGIVLVNDSLTKVQYIGFRTSSQIAAIPPQIYNYIAEVNEVFVKEGTQTSLIVKEEYIKFQTNLNEETSSHGHDLVTRLPEPGSDSEYDSIFSFDDAGDVLTINDVTYQRISADTQIP